MPRPVAPKVPRPHAYTTALLLLLLLLLVVVVVVALVVVVAAVCVERRRVCWSPATTLLMLDTDFTCMLVAGWGLEGRGVKRGIGLRTRHHVAGSSMAKGQAWVRMG
jgi:hypothetical protein